MQISVKLTNADKVQLGINTLGQALPHIVQDDIRKAMDRVQRAYEGSEPGGYSIPILPRQKYVRTGNLRRATTVIQSGMSFKFSSNAARGGRPYSVYVLGDGRGDGQAGIHLGRWPVAYDLIERTLEPMVIESTINQAIKKTLP